jgi:hypothetical protein
VAKISDKQWEKAKAYIEAGKSFRETEKLVGINYKTISDRCKRDKWKPHSLTTLIEETARNQAEILTLPPVQQDIVRYEIDKQVKMLEFFNSASVKNCQIMMKKVTPDANMEFLDHKTVQSTLREAKETVFGKMPDTVITNTNAQQTNKEKKVIFEVIGGTTRST